MNPLLRLSSATLAIVGLTHCSPDLGSVSRPRPAPVTGPAVNPNSVEKLQVSIFVPGRYVTAPAASSLLHSRQPRYLPLTVNSLGFAQTISGGTAVSGPTVVITIGSAACTNTVGGQTCSTTLVGQLGSDQWSVSSFTSSNGSGTALSVATLAKTILSGVANTSSLTLNPVLNGLAFVPTSSACNAVATCTPGVILNALDVTGATIVGPGSYVTSSGTARVITLNAASPVTLQKSGGGAANTTLTTTTDNDLSQLTYNGSVGPGTRTITAAATGVSTATYTLTLTTGTLTAPTSIAIGNTDPTSTTIPVSESAYSGTFSETDNCTGIASIGAASGNGPSATFPVSQIGGGTCSATIVDSHGGSAAVTIYSTTYVVTVQ